MCGIAGIVSLNGTDRIQPARLERMGHVLRHRGPDGDGVHVDGPVGLAHRRLAVVDVAGGAQPMASADGSCWISYNGEIYNHPELRAALEAEGRQYRTRCDTETILHQYARDGAAAPERLRGMFAFALWDARRQRLLLARDRLGIKPLYYAVTGRELLFASEIKALLEVMPGRPALDPDVLDEFLAHGFVSGEATLFAGIRRLAPGHTLEWAPGNGLQVRAYWQAPPMRADGPADLDTEAARLREMLTGAVRRHLMSDVPLGVFLSGGVDSTALTALTARLTGEQVRTFAVGYAEHESSELPMARLAAERLGTAHREVLVSAGDFAEVLPDLVWQEDEPMAFPSSVPLYFVAARARDEVTVVLSGEGADELFLGYNRYRVARWNQLAGRPYHAIMPARAAAAVRGLLGRLPRRIRRQAARTFLALDPDEPTSNLDAFAVFPGEARRALLGGRQGDPYRVHRGAAAAAGGVEAVAGADMHTYLHELLMKQDQMSMAASIESRVPFLDDTVVEHVLGLPTHLKLRGWTTKAVLREAVRDLVPPEILHGRKRGFPVPLGRWLRTSLQPLVDECVLGARARARGLFDPSGVARLAREHQAGAADHSHRLWLLINLEIWQRVFLDGEPRAAVTRACRPRTNHATAVGQDGRPLAARYGRAPS